MGMDNKEDEITRRTQISPLYAPPYRFNSFSLIQIVVPFVMVCGLLVRFGSIPENIHRIESLIEKTRGQFEQLRDDYGKHKEVSEYYKAQIENYERRLTRHEQQFDVCCPLYSPTRK